MMPAMMGPMQMPIGFDGMPWMPYEAWQMQQAWQRTPARGRGRLGPWHVHERAPSAMGMQGRGGSSGRQYPVKNEVWVSEKRQRRDEERRDGSVGHDGND